MNRKSIDVWVGLFVLLGFAALAFLALRAGNLGAFSRQSGATYEITARFDNIGGLKPRAPVKAAGVVVGRVDQIEFDDKNYQAVVHLALNDKYRFPKDSSVKILTAGLLGEQFLGIEPGADDKMLDPGASVTMTQSAVLLENLIGQLLYSRAADSGGTGGGSGGSSSAPAAPAAPAAGASPAPQPEAGK